MPFAIAIAVAAASLSLLPLACIFLLLLRPFFDISIMPLPALQVLHVPQFSMSDCALMRWLMQSFDLTLHEGTIMPDILLPCCVNIIHDVLKSFSFDEWRKEFGMLFFSVVARSMEICGVYAVLCVALGGCVCVCVRARGDGMWGYGCMAGSKNHVREHYGE